MLSRRFSQVFLCDVAQALLIGMGGRIAPPPLPHHRTYGSVYGGSIGYAFRPSINDGSPNEVREAFDKARCRAGLWLTRHGPLREPAVCADSSLLAPRRTSSAYRLRPVFHCRQKAHRTRLLTHESKRRSTEGVSQKPK